MINIPELMTGYSKRNLEVSKEFKSSILNERRREFYLRLREFTEK